MTRSSRTRRASRPDGSDRRAPRTRPRAARDRARRSGRTRGRAGARRARRRPVDPQTGVRLHLLDVREQRTVREHRRLRRAGGARGEQEDREIAARRRCGAGLRVRTSRRRRDRDPRSRRSSEDLRDDRCPDGARPRSAFAADASASTGSTASSSRASSCEGEPTLSGTATAPAASVPRYAATKAASLPATIATRSPGRAFGRRPRRHRGRDAASCPYVIGSGARERELIGLGLGGREQHRGEVHGGEATREPGGPGEARRPCEHGVLPARVPCDDPTERPREPERGSRPQLRTFLGRAGRLRCVDTRVTPEAPTRPHPRPEPRSRCEAAGRAVESPVEPASRRCPGPPSLYAK